MRFAWSALVAVVVSAALAQGPASAQPPAGDSVVGSGRFLATSFEVNVQAGPAGENPTGFLRLSGEVYNFEAEPTCLIVAGNVAVAGYRILTGPLAGTGFLAEVVDNGVTPPVGVPTDTLTYYQDLAAPPTTCPAPVGGPGSPLLFGDVTVVDASPGPTSADACRDGGWARFGFRNQGQCIAFIHRGPHPQ